jgi:hypothetical protein
MNRLLGVVALAATLAVWGCASPQAHLPPDRDPNELVAEIVRRGQGEGPPAPETPPEEPPRGSPVLPKWLEVSERAGAACLYLALYLLIAAAKGAH